MFQSSNLIWSFLFVDERWVSVEEVWSEDGEGESLPESLLSLHHVQRMPSPQTGERHLKTLISLEQAV